MSSETTNRLKAGKSQKAKFSITTRINANDKHIHTPLSLNGNACSSQSEHVSVARLLCLIGQSDAACFVRFCCINQSEAATAGSFTLLRPISVTSGERCVGEGYRKRTDMFYTSGHCPVKNIRRPTHARCQFRQAFLKGMFCVVWSPRLPPTALTRPHHPHTPCPDTPPHHTRAFQHTHCPDTPPHHTRPFDTRTAFPQPMPLSNTPTAVSRPSHTPTSVSRPTSLTPPSTCNALPCPISHRSLQHAHLLHAH